MYLIDEKRCFNMDILGMCILECSFIQISFYIIILKLVFAG